MKIKQNIGLVDRVFRIGGSCFMIYLGFFEHSIVTDEISEIILGVFGTGILITALVGNCPLYDVIGFTTCKVEHDDNPSANT